MAMAASKLAPDQVLLTDCMRSDSLELAGWAVNGLGSTPNAFWQHLVVQPSDGYWFESESTMRKRKPNYLLTQTLPFKIIEDWILFTAFVFLTSGLLCVELASQFCKAFDTIQFKSCHRNLEVAKNIDPGVVGKCRRLVANCRRLVG